MSGPYTRREFMQAAGTAAVAAAALPSALAQAGKTFNVAFVGVAHIHTPGYLDLVKRRPDVKIKSVWDHDAQRAGQRAQELGAKAVTEAGAIWSDPEIAAVIICSETNRHHDLVLAAAKAHKHMFVEKPLGITAGESKEMADAIEAAGLLFTTGYFQRTDPKHLFLKAEVAKGNFGKISRVTASNCHNGAQSGFFDGEFRWMADPKIAGVGAFGDLGTHKLDILMWIFGDVDSVSATVKPVTGKYGDCDETGMGLISFKSGVIGSLAAGWVDLADPLQFLISGTEGFAMDMGGRLYYQSKRVPANGSLQPVTNLPQPLRQPLEQFLDAVGGAASQPLVTPREAAARVAVMQAMYEAAREGKWVKIS